MVTGAGGAVSKGAFAVVVTALGLVQAATRRSVVAKSRFIVAIMRIRRQLPSQS